MRLKESFILVAIIMIQINCSDRKECNVEVNAAYIKSNCSMANGVAIRKVNDIVLNEIGFPSEYDEGHWASYGAESQEEFSRTYKHGLMIIFFKRETDGYRWIFHDTGSVSDTLPFNFEKNSWYLIDRLYEGGAPTIQLFIYVGEDGHFSTFRSDSKTNM